jgi:hypothetical protein
MNNWNKVLLALTAVGGPAGFLLTQEQFVSKHPILTLLAIIGFELVLGAGTLLTSVTGELVKIRLKQIGDTANHSLGRVFSRYGRRYQESILTRHKFIDSRDFSYGGDRTPQLEAIYIDLGVVQKSPHSASRGIIDDSASRNLARSSIHEYLDEEEPSVLVVLGVPGSGKSMLLRHLALRSAQQGIKGKRTIPVLLSLRSIAEEFSEDDAISLCDLIRRDTPELPVNEPSGWWEKKLHQGKCLVLFDGLDEIPNVQDRSRVTRWIERQIHTFPRNDFVVSSRPHGYRKSGIPQAQVLQVRPLSKDQVRTFIRSWTRFDEGLPASSRESPQELLLDTQTAELIHEIDSNPALSKLQSNPLLLTMIVLIHRERRALPSGYADLYREICEVMLGRRQQMSDSANALDQSWINREHILSHLAYTMMRQRLHEVSERFAMESIKAVLGDTLSDLESRSYLEQVLLSGLLVESLKGDYTFAHHSICEYLASKYIRDFESIQILVDEVDEMWWRETTLLYVAEAGGDQIVRACLDSGTTTALTLAFDCISRAPSPSLELVSELEQVKNSAFASTCSVEHRRLIAGILAANIVSQAVTTTNGAQVCIKTVSADLYWLFCQETETSWPDDHREFVPNSRSAAVGVWAQDVKDFVRWVNGILASLGLDGCRLPSKAEAEYVLTNFQTPGNSVSSIAANVWTSSEDVSSLQCWTGTGSFPHRISYFDMLNALVGDLRNSSMLLELSVGSVLAFGRERLDFYETSVRSRPQIRDFLLARSLRRDRIARRLRDATGNKLGAFELVDDAIRSLVRASVYEPERGVSRPLVFILDPDFDYFGSAQFDRYLIEFLDPEPELETERDSASRVDFNLRRSLGLDRSGDDCVISDPVTGLLQELSLELRGAIVRSNVMGAALACSFNAVLARISVDRKSLKVHELHEAFAEKFLHCTGVFDDFSTDVDLDALSAILRESCDAIASCSELKNTWTGVVSRRLELAAIPVFSRQSKFSDVNPTVLRVPALALATEADGLGMTRAAEGFRRIAAGVTLLEKRSAREVPLESIILARG